MPDFGACCGLAKEGICWLRVFQAFRIKAPMRIAALKHKAAEEKKKVKQVASGAKVPVGGRTTAIPALEREKKTKSGAKPARGRKRACFAET